MKAPKTHSTSRRKLLRTLAIGGVASSEFYGDATWVKPVVRTIVLPTHATTSEPQPPVVPPTPTGSAQLSSSGSFTIPDGVSMIQITASGAAGGGGGGGNAGMFDIGSDGGGGSRGAEITQSFTVTPGSILNVVIDIGGIGGTPWLATRRASGGFAGAPGGDTTVSGNGVQLLAQGGRGGGGGGGVIGGTQTAWMGDPDQNGSDGGAGGFGRNRAARDATRDGESSAGGFVGASSDANGGIGGQGDTSNFTRGSTGGNGSNGLVVINW